MIISWNAIDDGGSPYTAYTIFIRENDDATFTEDAINCDGTI